MNAKLKLECVLRDGQVADIYVPIEIADGVDVSAILNAGSANVRAIISRTIVVEKGGEKKSKRKVSKTEKDILPGEVEEGHCKGCQVMDYADCPVV